MYAEFELLKNWKNQADTLSEDCKYKEELLMACEAVMNEGKEMLFYAKEASDPRMLYTKYFDLSAIPALEWPLLSWLIQATEGRHGGGAFVKGCHCSWC